MKAKILKILKEADGYVSGQALCESLEVSRTAVWKVIRQLQEDGYDIEAVRNRGYRLADSGDVYTREELESQLHTEWLGKNLVFLDHVDSTNNRVKQLADQGAPEGTMVVAVEQSAGKGRRGRSWVSLEGTGVWMSFLLRPDFMPEHASALTLVAALSVIDGICQTTGIEGKIKWPNDIVIEGKKVCGILTEMSTEVESIHYIVVGIGINVEIKEFPEEIRQTATCLAFHVDKPVRRAKLVASVAESWEKYYRKFLQTLDMTLLKEEYNRFLVNLDRGVKVLSSADEYTGVSLGINDQGELLVKQEDGRIRTVMSGDRKSVV